MSEKRFVNRSTSLATARHAVGKLMELHVPLATEYLRGSIVLSVPFSFARTLDVTCDEVEQALADGAPVGGSAT